MVGTCASSYELGLLGKISTELLLSSFEKELEDFWYVLNL
jgi:hypothetical protein